MKKENEMKTIIVTQHEINQATRPNVYKNKKKYTCIACNHLLSFNS